jgi:hypothetical protein
MQMRVPFFRAWGITPRMELAERVGWVLVVPPDDIDTEAPEIQLVVGSGRCKVVVGMLNRIAVAVGVVAAAVEDIFDSADTDSYSDAVAQCS